MTANALWEAVPGKPGTQTWYESVHVTCRSPESEAARKAGNNRICGPQQERTEKALARGDQQDQWGRPPSPALASRFHEAGCPAGGQESRKCL
ncbi:hypothetical protein [Streptomyces afghaniensis]|uniref:hypothetical protein n=1 Tax=Streptomyces afghaniensis TaxID=66865 RepID=UPI00278019F1|nr:hypothetical protein [Streptomyces afghaniensis]MDQ1013605.1 hypothetical protein [Streptomyces afghaniensis]